MTLAFVLFGLFSSLSKNIAYAAINPEINFQGKLVNPDGTNVTDGSYSIVFSIYNVSSGGTAIWTETDTVTVTSGIFQVNLGAVTALPGSINFDTNNIYLGIKVGSDPEMTPRIQFTSVPQAFQANNADNLGGVAASGYAQLAGTQTFSAANTFQPTTNVTGLKILQNSNATPTADVFDVQGANGTSNFIQITSTAANQGAVTISSLGSNNLTLNSGSNIISVGATAITGTGALTVSSAAGTSSGAVAINSGNASSGTAGTVSIDTGTSSTGTSQVDIGTTNAGAVSIGKATANTTINGNLVVAANQNVTLNSGTGTFNQTYTNAAAAGSITGTFSANTVNATNYNNGASANTTNALNVGLTGTATSGGANTNNAINLGNITAATNNTFNGLYFGTGYNSLLNYNGTSLINGTGIIQNTAFSSSVAYTGITQIGTVTAGTWHASTIGVAYGGTGLTTLPTNGQLLIGNGSGYTLGTIGVSGGLTITNGVGSVNLGLSSTYSTSTSYIQNQNTSPQTANFDITGNGTIAGTLQAASVNATTALETSSVTRIDSSGDLMNIGLITSQGSASTDSIVLNRTIQSSSTTTTYYKIATLSPSTAGTYDHLHLLVTLNAGWNSTDNSYIDATFANRNSFAYQYTLKGAAVSSGATLMAYSNSNGSVDIYIQLGNASNQYTDASYSVVENIDDTVYANVSGTTTAPSGGSVVFDASVPTTYAPATTIDNSSNFIVSNDVQFGHFYTPAAPANGSTGEKIQLWGVAGTVQSTDYALGIQSSNMWFNSNGGYLFYYNGAQVASLDTSGNLSASGYIQTTAGGSLLFGGTTAVNGLGGAGGASFSGRPRIGDWGQWLEVGEPNGTNGGLVLRITNSTIQTCTSTGLTAAPTCRNTLDDGSGNMSASGTLSVSYTSANATYSEGTADSELTLNNPSGGSQDVVKFMIGPTDIAELRADSSGNVVLSGGGTGATYLAWDGGSGGTIFGNGSAGEVAHLDSSGDLFIGSGGVEVEPGNTALYIGGVSGSYAVCRSATANAVNTLIACNGAPIGDYAENYPVASGITYGDIVATGSNMVNIYGGTSEGAPNWTDSIGQITQEVKSNTSYQTNVVGVVSDNYGNFTSAGYNIKSSDNPMPVALNGRVPVNIAPDSPAIAPGDYITTSGTYPGMGTKATQAGDVVGMALGSWTPGTGQTQVEVFMRVEHWPGPNQASYLQNGQSAAFSGLNVSGNTTLSSLAVTGDADVNGNLTVGGSISSSAATIAGALSAGSLNITGNVSALGLTVTGDSTFTGNITVDGHIITAGGQPTSSVQTAAGAGATVTITGNDTTGTITINTGSNPTSGALTDILFSKAYTAAPHVVLSPSNSSAANLHYYKGNTTSTDFMFNTTDTPAPHTTYQFDYFIAQ